MRFALLVCITLLSSVPLSARSQEATSVRGVYIALGDSVAAGVGSSLPRERSYPSLVRGYMEQQFNGPIVLENIAEPGTSARSLLTDGQFDRFVDVLNEAAASELDVLAVTLTIGGNEVLEQADTTTAERETAMAEFEIALDELASMVLAKAGANVPVLITTLYDPTGTPVDLSFTDGWWIAQFNAVIRDVASDHGIAVADVAQGLGAAAQSLTRYPTDVHPTNAGYQAISWVVWDALGFDEEAPVIEVTSPGVTGRLTPTLRFSVSEQVRTEAISVSTGVDAAVYPIVEVGEREFVALLVFAAPVDEPIKISIEVQDVAGNAASLEYTITFAEDPPS